MMRSLLTVLLALVLLTPAAAADPLGKVLDAENKAKGVTRAALPVINDLSYLRRVTLDLVGRIPTVEEIGQFEALPATSRREKTVERLLADQRLADRWTIFFADMLRLRSNAEGGGASIAFIHRALRDRMPWDEMARRMISASGKAGATPELGFILGDNADPMALAGAAAQVFMGVRVACAQCHDHPFDVWTRKDFYGLAAFFGKTRRVQSQFTNTVYTTEAAQTSVLWPPEGVGEEGTARKPMVPLFPFGLDKGDRPTRPVARLQALRKRQATLAATAAGRKQANSDAGLEALLAAAGSKANSRSAGKKQDTLDVAGEAKRDARKLKVAQARYRASKLRVELARQITDPRNRLFAQSFVNRLWGELMGRGIVEPVDNFAESNPASHPGTLDFLADEFIASGYDIRTILRLVVNSRPYRRQHAIAVADSERIELESAFLATPMRRMLSEVLFDSIVAAGHLFDVKHEKGKNLKVVWQRARIAKKPTGDQSPAVEPRPLAATGKPAAKMKKPAKLTAGSPYDVENAIELDFDALLSESKEEVRIDRMKVMSKEEIEAMRMEQEAAQRRPDVKFFDRFIRTTFDDNPRFTSSMRTASPAAPEHFLRIFGQPSRVTLDEKRDFTPSMRQALMLLNGRLTHEASRVGELEPVYPLLAGKVPDVPAAVRLVYREILTRLPTSSELTEATELIKSSETPLGGMADLRWAMLNSNEFRFLP
ncbi:MAG: DUF1553 domain-containing protein [Planctomycetaceae bacterium]|jgi:hypothetical protein|nr:DUF1553 domain-containing protein [Planctomycetaceae bacterium]